MKSRAFFIYLILQLLGYACADTKAQTTFTICATQKNMKYMVTGDSGSIFHWNVEGGNIVSDPHSNMITVNWNSTPGEYSISVYEETNQGCLGNFKKVNVNLQSLPELNLDKFKSICEGDQVELNPGTGFNKYLWQDGSSQPKFIANTGGVYWVEVTNQNGCVTRDTVVIVMNALPKVDLGKDTVLCGNDQLMLDAGNVGASYQWNNGANSQTILASESDGQIWVKVVDANGCAASDTIQILKCTSHQNIVIPNAFTPNGDGHNDYWLIRGSQNYPNMTVKIYNRWGDLIFQSDHGYFKPWDGTSNGMKQPVDVYYYLINLEDGSKEIVGSVTLIR